MTESRMKCAIHVDSIRDKINAYTILVKKKVKKSRYTPWRRLGGEEV
jgi:hypothetical protein